MDKRNDAANDDAIKISTEIRVRITDAKLPSE